ncbi:MAG: hypothetical protein MHPSP_000014 [Paramarteilia canceri]
MKPQIKKAVDFFVQKRIKRLKIYSKSKDYRVKKIETNENYINIAKHLNFDIVTKFLIWNEENENQIEKKDYPVERKVAFQVGKAKNLDKNIEKFRKYSDWKEMANFLLMKNTSRQDKKVEASKSQAYWLPIPEAENSKPSKLATKWSNHNNIKSCSTKKADKVKEIENKNIKSDPKREFKDNDFFIYREQTNTADPEKNKEKSNEKSVEDLHPSLRDKKYLENKIRNFEGKPKHFVFD